MAYGQCLCIFLYFLGYRPKLSQEKQPLARALLCLDFSTVAYILNGSYTTSHTQAQKVYKTSKYIETGWIQLTIKHSKVREMCFSWFIFFAYEFAYETVIWGFFALRAYILHCYEILKKRLHCYKSLIFTKVTNTAYLASNSL